MSSDTTRFLDLLERRLALLSSLAAALTAARTDIVSLDVSGLEARLADQEKLCTEIRALDTHIDRIQRQCTTHAIPPASQSSPDALRCREILARLAATQAAVQQLNQQHRALLRRSRRTVHALLNSYHSFAMTYANPADPRASRAAGLPAETVSASRFSSAEGGF